MPKYAVYGIVTATKFLGTFEAGSEDEAKEMALSSNENSVSICHRCNDGLQLDDVTCHAAVVEQI